MFLLQELRLKKVEQFSNPLQNYDFLKKYFCLIFLSSVPGLRQGILSQRVVYQSRYVVINNWLYLFWNCSPRPVPIPWLLLESFCGKIMANNRFQLLFAKEMKKGSYFLSFGKGDPWLAVFARDIRLKRFCIYVSAFSASKRWSIQQTAACSKAVQFSSSLIVAFTYVKEN